MPVKQTKWRERERDKAKERERENHNRRQTESKRKRDYIWWMYRPRYGKTMNRCTLHPTRFSSRIWTNVFINHSQEHLFAIHENMSSSEKLSLAPLYKDYTVKFKWMICSDCTRENAAIFILMTWKVSQSRHVYKWRIVKLSIRLGVKRKGKTRGRGSVRVYGSRCCAVAVLRKAGLLSTSLRGNRLKTLTLHLPTSAYGKIRVRDSFGNLVWIWCKTFKMDKWSTSYLNGCEEQIYYGK